MVRIMCFFIYKIVYCLMLGIVFLEFRVFFGRLYVFNKGGMNECLEFYFFGFKFFGILFGIIRCLD